VSEEAGAVGEVRGGTASRRTSHLARRLAQGRPIQLRQQPHNALRHKRRLDELQRLASAGGSVVAVRVAAATGCRGGGGGQLNLRYKRSPPAASPATAKRRGAAWQRGSHPQREVERPRRRA